MPLAIPGYRMLTGVTSMSVDLDRHGYAPRGCSVALFRDVAFRRHMYVRGFTVLLLRLR